LRTVVDHDEKNYPVLVAEEVYGLGHEEEAEVDDVVFKFSAILFIADEGQVRLGPLLLLFLDD
jgi:hypothetical protein